VDGFVSVFGDLDRRAFDQGCQLAAGGVRIYAVSEGLPFPLEPRLQARSVEFTRGRPVEEAE
jgi:hypothetical protein